MRIYATTVLNHVQAEMTQRRRNNVRSIVESKYVSLCGLKPGSKAALQKPKNIDSEHLLGGDLKKTAKVARPSNAKFRKSVK